MKFTDIAAEPDIGAVVSKVVTSTSVNVCETVPEVTVKSSKESFANANTATSEDRHSTSARYAAISEEVAPVIIG